MGVDALVLFCFRYEKTYTFFKHAATMYAPSTAWTPLYRSSPYLGPRLLNIHIEALGLGEEAAWRLTTTLSEVILHSSPFARNILAKWLSP